MRTARDPRGVGGYVDCSGRIATVDAFANVWPGRPGARGIRSSDSSRRARLAIMPAGTGPSTA